MQISNLKLFINLNPAPNAERKSSWPSEERSKPLDALWPKSMSQSGSSARKAAAAAKIAELKMRLEAMLKFAGIGKGNPEAAIRLAKELAAAVRAYGGAGGGSAVTVPQFNVASSGEAAADTTDAGAANATTGDVASSAALAAAASTAAAAATNAAATSNAKSSESTGATGDLKVAESSANSAQASKEPAKSPQTNGRAEKGLTNEDKNFLAEAASLMQKIKMLIKLETKKAEDEKKAQAAIAEMEKAMKDAPAAIAQDNQAAESIAPTVSTEYNASGATVDAVPETPAISVSV